MEVGIFVEDNLVVRCMLIKKKKLLYVMVILREGWSLIFLLYFLCLLWEGILGWYNSGVFLYFLYFVFVFGWCCLYKLIELVLYFELILFVGI